MIAVSAVGFSTLGFGDARAYVGTAKALVETGRYPVRVEPFFFRPPAYPVFLAAVTLGHPEWIAVAKVANSVLGALLAPLLAALSLKLFRRRGVAAATGVAAALHPAFVMMATEVQSEPLFLVLLVGSGFLLLAASDRPSSNLALAAGIALGLAALTRSTALVLAPFLLVPLADRRYPTRARRHLAASALVGFAAALLPWTIRNAIVFRELLPVNDAGGYSFYHGNSVWTSRYYAIRTRPEYDRWLVDFDADMRRRMAAVDRDGVFTPGRRSAFFKEMAIAEIRADPAAEARLIAQKTWQWLRPYPTPWFWPAAVVVGVGVLYVVLDVLAVVGLATARRRGVVVFCVGVLAVAMAAHVVLLVVWRYRAPYWDPILILFAVPAAAKLVRRG